MTLRLDELRPAALRELKNAGYNTDTVELALEAAILYLDASTNIAAQWLSGATDLVETDA